MQIFFLRILWHWIFNENIRDSGNYQQKWCKYFLKNCKHKENRDFKTQTHSKWKNTQQIWWFTRKIEKMFLIHFQITRKLQSHIIDSKWQKENDEMWFLFGDYFLIYRVDVNGWLCRTMVSQRAILFRFFFFLCSHSISFWSLLPLFRSLSSLYYCSLEMKLRRKCVLYALNHPNIGIDRE